jgi:hypothetical protein
VIAGAEKSRRSHFINEKDNQQLNGLIYIKKTGPGATSPVDASIYSPSCNFKELAIQADEWLLCSNSSLAPYSPCFVPGIP